MAPAPTPNAAGPVRPARVAWLGAGLVAIVLLVYANSLNAPFIFDDFQAVTLNPTIRDLGRWRDVFNPPLDGAGVTGRPLVNFSFALNYAVHRLDVRGYHAASILLHALSALTLFGLLRRLCLLPALAPRWGAHATSRSFGISLLWAVHPLLTESVVCIVQRNEVLAGLLYLATLYAFVRSAAPDATVRRWQVVSIMTCLLGVTAKEIVATAPLLVLLCDRTFVAGSFAAAWRQRRGYYALLAATWLPLGWLMLRADQRAGIVGFGLGMGSWEYLVTQCHALVLYLKLSLWPHPLVVDYGHQLRPLASVWPQAVLVVSLGLATVWALWRRPRWGFAGACFFVILAPSSSIVPLTTQTVAEHRMYLPLVVVAAGLVLALEKILPRGWRAAGLVLAGGAAALTVARNADYRDELTFWNATLVHQPDNARVYANIGDYHRRHREWEPAAAAFRRATELRPHFALAHSELGSMLVEMGRVSEGLEQHRLALATRPDDAHVQYNYGVACARAGNPAAAAWAWEKALQLRPGMTPAIHRLAELSLQNGDIPGALARYEEAARQGRADADILDGWGRALTTAGRFPEAVQRLESARDLRPDVAEIHYNLGNARLHLNQAGVAIPIYREALRLKPNFPRAHHNLGVALMQSGQLAEAVASLETAVRQQPATAEFHLSLAFALEQSGRRPEAIAQTRETLQLDPGAPRAREFLRHLETANPP